MCRYAMYGPYKQHYACFDCRRSFKWPLDARVEFHAPAEVRCPECGTPAHAMGYDFKPPRQHDRRQWEKVRLLFAHGYTYDSCGCGGPGYRPRTLAEVPAFLAHRVPRSPGEAILRSIRARGAAPAEWKETTSASANARQPRHTWPQRSLLQKVRSR